MPGRYGSYVELPGLSDAERAWLEADERRWRRAHALAAARPGVDASGIYHVIRNLELDPSARLRKGLLHGRGFGAHRR
jgi:hypothetical protein